MTITELLADLEAKAKQATPGPWAAEIHVSALYRGLVAIIEQSPEEFIGVTAEDDEVPSEQWKANALHIAACSPDRILALVAYVRKLVGATDFYVKEIHRGILSTDALKNLEDALAGQ